MVGLTLIPTIMQTIDPTVTRAKFIEELEKFTASKDRYRQRGILLLDAAFPTITIGFAVVKLKPSPLAFAVRFDFENYDFEPLSARFVDPFSFEMILTNIPLLRKSEGGGQPQNLTQQDQTGLPFICMPGTREYHSHPAHTGNSWLLHRKKGGEGSLGFLIEKFFEYGVMPMTAFQFQVIVQTPQLSLYADINLLQL